MTCLTRWWLASTARSLRSSPGIEYADLKLGESVVIQGAGGLGVYAAAVAKEAGAERVVIIDGVDERLELAREFGADETIDLRQFPESGDRIKRVLELCNDWGGDVVVELVGHPGVMDEGLRMTAPEGRYLEIGNINVGWKGEIDPSLLVFGNRKMIGVSHYEADHLEKALKFMQRTRENTRTTRCSPTSSRSTRSTTRSPSKRTDTSLVGRWCQTSSAPH